MSMNSNHCSMACVPMRYPNNSSPMAATIHNTIIISCAMCTTSNHLFPRAMADRSAGGGPTNRWRWLMATEFDEETYGQRWQVETVMFMLKRHQGAALTARTYHTRRREMGLLAITHNIMIVLPEELFYRALPSHSLVTPSSR